MRDPYLVLSEKEERANRVRKEIQALLTVIPLLNEEAPSWEELKAKLVDANPGGREPIERTIKELELYFPFVRTLKLDRGTAD